MSQNTDTNLEYFFETAMSNNIVTGENFMKIELLYKETFNEVEASEYLKIPVKSLRYYSVQKKAISYSYIGKTKVFRKADLEAFLDQNMKICEASY